MLFVFILGATFWMEHAHRVDIAVPADASMAAVGTGCSDRDNVPYGATCLAFLGVHDHIGAAGVLGGLPSTDSREQNEVIPMGSPAVCPDSDNRPYTASCIQFMSGWFWRVN
jgi:hypothetical protein